MILVDTSVWVDHLRRRNQALVGLLEAGMVLAHPFVIGEIALGNLHRRDIVLHALSGLPHATVATNREVLLTIERDRLHGRGIGYVDVHLLASARLTHGAELWTRDKRLRAAAMDLGVAAG